MEKEDALRTATESGKRKVESGKWQREGEEVEGAAAIRELRVARSTSRT